MFDARYHALSLAAVLIALGIGLLLGVAIGDKGVVTKASNGLAQNLLRKERSQNAQLSTELSVRRSFEDKVYPELVADRLAGERFGLVFLGGSSDALAGQVDAALQGTGAALRYAAVVRDHPDLGALASQAPDPARFAALPTDPGGQLRPFARSLGRSLLSGGRLAGAERQTLLSSFKGRLGRVDGIILARVGKPPTGADAKQVTDLQEGLVEGMKADGRTVVGIEAAGADPSQVPWYQSLGLSSVDDVDDLAGRAALVFVLGGATGSYGVKPLATGGLLPLLPSGSPGG